jgi:hypothetical protein
MKQQNAWQRLADDVNAGRAALPGPIVYYEPRPKAPIAKGPIDIEWERIRAGGPPDEALYVKAPERPRNARKAEDREPRARQGQREQQSSSAQPPHKNKKRPVTINDVRFALKDLSVGVKYNLMSGRMEISGMPEKYSLENAPNTLPTMLTDFFKCQGINCSRVAMGAYLNMISDEGRYHPVADMLNKTE